MKRLPEIWLPVPAYEGIYEVSNHGRINSLERKDANKHPVKERILLPDLSAEYSRYTLCKPNTLNYRFSVHILVATLWVPNPENKPEVNHKNGIKSDPYFGNLEWATRSENALHGYRTGLMTPSRAFLGRVGILHPQSIPIVQLTLDGLPVREWESIRLAAMGLGIQQSNISAVCRGRRPQAGGYKWEKLNQKI